MDLPRLYVSSATHGRGLQRWPEETSAVRTLTLSLVTNGLTGSDSQALVRWCYGCEFGTTRSKRQHWAKRESRVAEES